jgi:hypothetical protein
MGWINFIRYKSKWIMMKFIGKMWMMLNEKWMMTKRKLSMNNKLILIHYGWKTWFMNKPLLNLIDPTQECTNKMLQIDHRWITWANFGNSSNGYRHGHHFGLPLKLSSISNVFHIHNIARIERFILIWRITFGLKFV